MKNACLPSAAVLLLGSFSAAAESIPPLVVTASRTAETGDQTLSSVTVISREDIERAQASSVATLLRGVPGVIITNNGGAGKSTSVFLRGTESDHVLVLIDGIKVGSATLGTTAFQDIPVEQIDRIEIVRGPRSSLYGSEAIGGVIQIFTRKGGGRFSPYFTVGVGSYHSYEASVGVSGGGDHGWFNATAGGIDTKGFNACEGLPSPGGAGCYTDEPDKDGYRNVSATLHAGYRFENETELDVHALRVDSDNEFDGGYVNASESAQQVVGGTLRFAPLAVWQAELTVGRSLDDADNFLDGIFRSRFDTQRDTRSLQNNITLGPAHLFTFGADDQTDRVDSTTAYSVNSRDNTGLFSQYQGAFGHHDLQLALRRDDNEQFGRHGTGSAAWGWSLNDRLRFTAAYGTAFKAPTFNELYFPGYGNPDLDPETAKSLELGLNAQLRQGAWSLHIYENRVTDLIAFDAATFSPANIAQARIRGVEALLDYRLGDWNLRTNLTLLDPENQSEDSNSGNTLPRRARQTVRFDVDGSVGGYRYGATLLAETRRYDDLENSRELAGYATIDLRAETTLGKNWRIQGRIENLFDKHYETAAFFNQPGISLYMTLRYQPENI